MYTINMGTAAENRVQDLIDELTELRPIGVQVLFGRCRFTNSLAEYHMPTRTITISNNTYDDEINPIQQLSSLSHELRHAECEVNRCSCSYPDDDRALSEYHAGIAQVRYALRHTSVSGLMKHVFYHIATQLNSGSRPHAIAARRIIKLKTWKKLEYKVGIA